MNKKIQVFSILLFFALPSSIFGKNDEITHSTNPHKEESLKNAWRLYEEANNYVKGNGVNQDHNKAYTLYLKAAEQGLYEAQYSAGILLLDGKGTEKNIDQALKWLEKSARKGYRKAQFKLATIFEKDEKNLDVVEAYAWYYVASINGLMVATDKTVQLQAKLSEKELISAKERGRQYFHEIANQTTTNNVIAPVDYSPSKKSRTYQEISAVFDRNKFELFLLYQDLLKSNPNANGKIVFYITIEPDGIVSNVKVVEDEVNHKTFTESLSRVIKNFNFGEKDTDPFYVTYPLDFLPQPPRETPTNPPDRVIIKTDAPVIPRDFNKEKLWYDYENKLMSKIHKYLFEYYPHDLVGKEGSVKIRLKIGILSDGYIKNIEVLESTGTENLNNWVIDEIKLLSPFREFPQKLKRRYNEAQVTKSFTFVPAKESLLLNKDTKLCYTIDECVKSIRKKIERNWNFPEVDRERQATVYIALNDNAEVVKFNIEQSSESKVFDESLRKAVFDASPFTQLAGLDKNIFKRFKEIKLIFDPMNTMD